MESLFSSAISRAGSLAGRISTPSLCIPKHYGPHCLLTLLFLFFSGAFQCEVGETTFSRDRGQTEPFQQTHRENVFLIFIFLSSIPYWTICHTIYVQHQYCTIWMALSDNRVVLQKCTIYNTHIMHIHSGNALYVSLS